MSKKKIIEEIDEFCDVLDKMAEGKMTPEKLDEYLSKKRLIDKGAK